MRGRGILGEYISGNSLFNAHVLDIQSPLNHPRLVHKPKTHASHTQAHSHTYNHTHTHAHTPLTLSCYHPSFSTRDSCTQHHPSIPGPILHAHGQKIHDQHRQNQHPPSLLSPPTPPKQQSPTQLLLFLRPHCSPTSSPPPFPTLVISCTQPNAPPSYTTSLTNPSIPP